MTGEAAGRKVQGGLLLFGLALALAVAAIGYRMVGGSGDETSEVSADTANLSLDELARLAESAGNDASLWQRLGFARFDAGEFAGAADAYRKALAIDTEQAVLWSALGEALVMASERDPMPAEALEAFRKAIALDGEDPRARYFLAVKRDLDGDHEGAIADWLALLRETPPGAPWENDLARTIEQVGKINTIDVAPRLAAAQAARKQVFVQAGAPQGLSAGNAIPGPSAAQLQAAGGIPPGKQRQMAEGMVASLEGKLKANPGNIEGWVMLMRSRIALDQTDRARKALADAIAANPGSAERLRQEAELLGLR